MVLHCVQRIIARQVFILAISVGLSLACRNLAAQSNQPAVFVANDGNLEGSVSAYRIQPDQSLAFVEKEVIGETDDPTNDPDPGTNAHTLSLTPDGRYLAVGHATGNDASEQITMLRVNADATVDILAAFTVPDSPLAVRWVDDQYLAVTRTSLTVTNEVRIYQFDPGVRHGAGASLTFIDAANTGSFTTSIAIHPTTQFVFAQSSFGDNNITSLEFNGGMLALVEVESTGATYPLGMGIAPDGTKLYACGGISSGGNALLGYFIDGVGMLDAQPGAPYVTPGQSPSQIAISADSRFAYVGHGTDATVRTFEIDDTTGALTATGFFFDVGTQGSLGEVEVLDGLLLVLDKDTVSDGVKGLYSFSIQPDGSFTQNGALVDSTGSRPTELEGWNPGTPPCPEDLTEPFGTVDSTDLLYAVDRWNSADAVTDIDGDGVTEVEDLVAIRNAFGPCE